MIIVFCIDSNYSNYASVSIASYKKHNPNAKIIVVSEELIDNIGYDENVIIKLPKMFRNRGYGDRITNTAYLRLFLTQLPYEKVLYVDADTICQKQLYDLWNQDIEYIGATESHVFGKKQAEELGIDKYALSGMMLMNLANLRKLNFTEESIKVIDEIPTLKTGFCHEESVLNYRWNDKITFLPVCFNYCHNRTYENPINEEDAYILHYVGRDKEDMLASKKYGNLPIDYITGRSVAIVGNAKSLFDYKYGEEIDKHDIVIRFNKGFPNDKESQGSKTSILMLACELSKPDIQYYKAKYVIRRSNSYENSADFTVSNKDRRLLKDKLGSQPSTGFMAIDICLEAHAKSIDLYGFDFEATPTFYNSESYKTLHDYNKEQEIVSEYERAGLLKINKGA